MCIECYSLTALLVIMLKRHWLEVAGWIGWAKSKVFQWV